MAFKEPRRTPLVFYRQAQGIEPVRAWLKMLNRADRFAIGQDLVRVQFRWPIGMPLCRSLDRGLWEVRTTMPSRRIARVLFCLFEGELWALHAFTKKTPATPLADIEIARRRMKQLER